MVIPKKKRVILDLHNDLDDDDEKVETAGLVLSKDKDNLGDSDIEDLDLTGPPITKRKFTFKKISKEKAMKIKDLDQSNAQLPKKENLLEVKDETVNPLSSSSRLNQLAEQELETTSYIKKEDDTKKEESDNDNDNYYSDSDFGPRNPFGNSDYSDYSDTEDAQDIQADREWYTQDEAVGNTMGEEQYYNDNDTQLDYDYMKKQKLTLSSKKNFQSEWFDRKLKQSRISNSSTSNSANDDDFNEYDELNEVDDNRRQILVHRLTPPFIDSSTVMADKIQIFNPVKDPTGDLYNYSKNGSSLVNEKRLKRDRNKNAKDAVKVEGTAIGNLIEDKDEINDKKSLGQSQSPADENESRKFTDVLKEQYEQETHAKNDHDDRDEDEAVRPLSIKEQRRQLPAFHVRSRILKTINENQVVIIIGETGSGKTTQICQFLYEEGYHHRGLIGVTQPRRVAAMSVAKRVSEEMGVKLGNEVGFTIRFEDFTNEKTKIKFMTDGILLRESLLDSDLDKYSCIIIDEAHERSLNTDILLGFMKQLLARRRDLKIIVTSATMNAEKFSRFFGNAPNFTIPGRTYPVDVLFSKVPSMDYVDSAIKQVLRIHIQNKGKRGDVLVFMTGQEDIETTCDLLDEELNSLIRDDDTIEPMEILPIYSTLPEDLQNKIFNKSKNRKCIISTNIAETSLTVDGILYVVDCGLCKLKVYNPQLNMDSLQIVPISLAQANQRSGRAGRTAPGVAYRLYTQTASVEEMFAQPIPEIQRTNLINILLILKKLGVEDLTKFPFLDVPSVNAINTAQYDLWSLGALDNFGGLTELGNKMSNFPIEPVLSKLLILSSLKQFSCSQEILIIISMLSIPSVFQRPNDASLQQQADKAREKFYVPESDHLTLLNVYNNFMKNRSSERWCNLNFLNHKSLRRAREIKDQLTQIMNNNKLPIVSAGLEWDIIRKCICASFFSNGAQLKKFGEYVNLRTGLEMRLHPTSALFGMGDLPRFVIYHEVLLLGKNKQYMNYISSCDLEWLCEYGQVFYSLKEKGTTSLENQKMKEYEFEKLLETQRLQKGLIEKGNNGRFVPDRSNSSSKEKDKISGANFDIRKRRRIKF